MLSDYNMLDFVACFTRKNIDAFGLMEEGLLSEF